MEIVATDQAIEVEDLDGTLHTVSLLAFDGPPPENGEWLVVHSGYVIDRADADEAEAVAAEISLAKALTGQFDEGHGQ